MVKKMTALAMTIAIIAVCTMPITTYAARKCSYPDCDRSVDSGSYCRLHKCSHEGCSSAKGNNGTIYCDTHAAEYVRKQGYTPCLASGCYRKTSKDHSYCSYHECKKSDCTKKKVTGSDYCSSHQPISKATTGSSTKSATSSKSSTSSSASRKSSSSTGTTNKYDPYDVYSYSSAQSFADDKYEEFFDYEDDYEDEDEAYDAAEDYWYDHH